MIVLKEVMVSDIISEGRFREDLGDVDSLVLSFKKEGVIQPLAVRDNEDGSYKLLAGGRRYDAAVKAKLETVPVRCYPADISELEMRSIELMENVCRKDLSWIEDAKLKKEIYLLQVAIHGEKHSTNPNAPGVSKRDVADLLGKSHFSINQDIQLADALEIFPELEKAKNKNEANKMLSKFQEEMIKAEITKRIEGKVASTPTEKLHQDLISRYIVGDFFDRIGDIPTGSVDFIELDPPYAMDLLKIKKDVGENTNYEEIKKEDYPAFMETVIKECVRVMSSNSWIVVWHAMEWRHLIHNLLVASKLRLNDVGAIWNKGNTGQTLNPDMDLASCYEPFLYARKGDSPIIRQGRSNVFSFKPVSSMDKTHITERPIEMIQEIMQIFCWEGARVFVPFLGSGNSILSACNIGLKAFGFDLSQENKDSYALKVISSTPGKYRSYKEGI